MAEVSQPTTRTSIPKKRPTGITILAILLILGAIMNALSIPSNVSMYGPIFGTYTAVAAAVGFILATGLWQLLPWARLAAIVWYIIAIALGFIIASFIASMLGPAYFSILILALVPAWIIWVIVIVYLMQPSVYAAFEGGMW